MFTVSLLKYWAQEYADKLAELLHAQLTRSSGTPKRKGHRSVAAAVKCQSYMFMLSLLCHWRRDWWILLLQLNTAFDRVAADSVVRCCLNSSFYCGCTSNSRKRALGFWVVYQFSVITYFTWCNITVCSRGISMKLCTNIHLASGHCWIGLQGQKTRIKVKCTFHA